MNQGRSIKDTVLDKLFNNALFFIVSILALVFGPVLVPMAILGLLVHAFNDWAEAKPPKTVSLVLESVSDDGNGVVVSIRHMRENDWVAGSRGEPVWTWGDGLEEGSFNSGVIPPGVEASAAHVFAPREGRRSVCATIRERGEWSEWRRRWINQTVITHTCLQLPPPKFSKLSDF